MMGNSTVNAPMSVVFRFIPSQTMPRTSAAMMFSECTMSDCSTKDMPAIDPCDTVAMTGVANPIMAQQSKGLQNEDASTLGETVRVGTSARPSRRAIRSWPSSAATLSVASAAMVSAMVDASSVKNARYGTADSTDPSTISTFAMSGPSANNARAQQKKQQVAELSEKLKGAVTGVIVDYKGITVADDTKLRKSLREGGNEYKVVKNTLLGRALKEAGIDGLDSVLEGTTAIAISNEDYVGAAKILCEYAEKSKTFEVKAGFVDGKMIDAEGVKNLAKLPSKEVLLAQVLGGLNAPITGFATVLNGTMKGLVVALNAIAEKKGAEA